MSDFDIKIEVDGIPTGGFFNSIKNLFNSELRKAEEDISKKLLYDARENHEYKHQSRKLRNATKVKGKLSGKDGLVLYVDLSKADYAEYVIKGHGTWNPDPFITNALENNKLWIQNRIQEAVDTAVVQFNRIK